MKSFVLLSLSSIALQSVQAVPYFLTENIFGKGFYSHFDWQAIDDPTHGRVTYVDKHTSIRHNLTYATFDSFILRTDSKSVINPEAPKGRNSVRIRSKKLYTTHVAVFDVKHMPQGCGTWPAIWETLEENWPTGGEIDVLEGVNDQGPNHSTLHTVKGCEMPEKRFQTGTSGQLDCDWTVNWNTGCGVAYPDKPESYGPGLNARGGGWFVLERTDKYISLWFWARHDRRVPREVREPGFVVDPRKFGIPTAHFPNTSCDFPKFFKENNIIINLTLCGDWAGNPDVYAASGCPGTCAAYVDENPAALKDAYFNLGGVRVYERR